MKPTSPFAPIFDGLRAADAWFIALVQERTGCSESEARRVLDLYNTSKLHKRDHIARRYNPKHGAYYETSSFTNALGIVR